MQNGYRDVVHRGHWVDGNCPFYDAIAANHSKMDLSIRGRRGFKDASPINVPTGEIVRASRAMAKRNGCPCNMRQAMRSPASESGRLRRDAPWDPCRFEIATVLRSSRVAFCFSFRHSWKHRAQISKRPTVINPQSQTQ